MPQSRAEKGRLAALIGSTAAVALTTSVALWEGDRNVGYRDLVGIATVCRGITGPGVVVGRRYSDAECEALNERGAIEHLIPVLACTPSLRDKPNQLAAAGSLAYNIGTAAYCRSGVDRRFDAGDIRGACDAFLAWNRAGGRVVRGLANRRAYERQLCLKGL